MTEKRGSLVCVGPGVIVGAHISIRCQKHIEQADVVFSNCHPIMQAWIETMHSDVRSLQEYYGEGKDRRITYREMTQAILEQVRAGKRVVGVFYGHPGVFAKVPHRSIAQAKEEGFDAWMEPGISAEDCLYADMGIDPGDYGCQHYEASQFLFCKRTYDPSAYLILWQIALAGDITIAKRLSSPEERQFLVSMLKQDYPGSHKVALYESPTLITDAVREEWISLDALPTADLTSVTTLVIPPCKPMTKDPDVINAIRALSE